MFPQFSKQKNYLFIFVGARQVPVSTSMGSGPMGKKQTGSQTENETIVALRVKPGDNSGEVQAGRV